MKIFLPFIACSLMLATPITAGWRGVVLPVTEYGHSVEDDSLFADYTRVSKPPFFTGTVGPRAVDLTTNTAVTDSKAYGFESRIEYAHTTGKHLEFFAGIGLTLLEQRITYDISYWNQYYGFNPLTLGFGSPPILIGRTDVPVESFHLIPQIVLGASYVLTDQLSISLQVQFGYGYAVYEDYDFYNQVHQRTRVIPEDEQEALHSRGSDWISRHSIGIELNYDLSERWSLSLRQSFIRSSDYELVNAAESNASIDTMTIYIEHQTQHQTALGVRYAF